MGGGGGRPRAGPREDGARRRVVEGGWAEPEEGGQGHGRNGRWRWEAGSGKANKRCGGGIALWSGTLEVAVVGGDAPGA